jgi:hypothetical protein
MECFYHPATPAVGLCKHCQKGLCRACAVDIDGDGLACRNRHEQDVTLLNSYIRRAPQTGSRSGLLLVAGGVVFESVGLLQAITTDLGLGIFLLASGFVFILMGINQLRAWRSRQTPVPASAPNEFQSDK